MSALQDWDLAADERSEYRPPSQYNRCECGAWKAARSVKCLACTYPHLGVRHDAIRYVACGCGRERRIDEAKCAVCQGAGPVRCIFGPVRLAGKTRHRTRGCGADWHHGHCYNCGQPCALNWPLCGDCEGIYFGLRRHQSEELGRQTHGDFTGAQATRGRIRVALIP